LREAGGDDTEVPGQMFKRHDAAWADMMPAWRPAARKYDEPDEKPECRRGSRGPGIAVEAWPEIHERRAESASTRPAEYQLELARPCAAVPALYLDTWRDVEGPWGEQFANSSRLKSTSFQRASTRLY
jgi:hypothetical protein